MYAGLNCVVWICVPLRAFLPLRFQRPVGSVTGVLGLTGRPSSL